MIPQNVIDRICDLDIVRIIEDEGISLKKKGTSWECCCPFHNEKTPSFIVTPSKNLYKCFGCGEGGNVISFIMKFRNLEFLDAVEYLAEKHGIEYEKKSRQQKREKQDSGKSSFLSSTRQLRTSSPAEWKRLQR